MSGPIRLGGVPEHFNLPWHLALASPGLAAVRATWQDQLGGTGEILAGLEDGSLDVVSVLTEGTVAAIADGLPATIIQIYVSSPLQWGVFVPADSDLRSEDDLEGRQIAISRFRSGSHLMAYVLAERNGWGDIDDSQFVVTGGLEGARNAFAAGEAEVFLWDRFMTEPLVDVGEFRRIVVNETPWPSFVIAARNEVLLGRTTEVGRIVDAVVAEAEALASRPTVLSDIAQRYWLDEDTAQEWLSSTTFAPRSTMSPDLADQVLATLTDAGFRSTAPV